MKSFILPFFLFLIAVASSQNKTDILLTQQIPKLLASNTSEEYLQAKDLLLNLEKETGVWPEEKLRLLSASYRIGDLEFFKLELLNLIEHNGFDYIQLNNRMSYYRALTSGELSSWFKKNYPLYRALWLEKNQEKLHYIKALNDLYTKDQTLGSFATTIKSQDFETEKTFKKLDSILIDQTKNNFIELLDVYNELGMYPSAKTFALPQTAFFLVEIHALKTPSISKQCFEQIYPYYEKAYLNNEITYLAFKDYDAQMLFSTGKQYFGTLKEHEIPESYLDENGKIPVLDEINLKERRAKLGWD